jgi:hypothetical protein
LIYFRKSNFNDIFVESKPPVYLGMSPKWLMYSANHSTKRANGRRG